MHYNGPVILDILTFPDPRLRTRAQAVRVVDQEIRGLVDNMLETMYYSGGIGLAATQVNVHKRVVVMDLSEERNEPMVFINPTVTVCGEAQREFEEGCLSVPGYSGLVNRPDNVVIDAVDRNGKAFTKPATGLLAVCIQHEIDHLEGIVFVDYLSPLKRERIRHELRGKELSVHNIRALHEGRRARYRAQNP